MPRGPLETAEPLYQQLSDRIRRDIRSGRYRGGQQIPTESELITQYGVSRITVRRALQDLAADGFLVGVKGKGTFVNPSPFTAVDTFLFVYGNELGLQYPFTSTLLHGICDVNTQRIAFRLEMLALPSLDKQTPADHRVEDLVSHTEINGVISLYRLRPDTLQYLVDRTIPVVQIGLGAVPPPPGVVVLATPLEKGLRLIVEHLRQRGRKRIGYIDQPSIEAPEMPRRRLHDFFATYGLPFPDEAYDLATWGIHGGMEGARRLLDRCPDLDTIIASDDMQALGAMRTLELAGRVVGRDVAVTGAGNFLGDHSNCGLTTIDPHIVRCGEMATRCLREMIDGKKHPPIIEFEPELVVREST